MYIFNILCIYLHLSFGHIKPYVLHGICQLTSCNETVTILEIMKTSLKPPLRQKYITISANISPHNKYQNYLTISANISSSKKISHQVKKYLTMSKTLNASRMSSSTQRSSYFLTVMSSLFSITTMRVTMFWRIVITDYLNI